jgi:hypothetical protein
VAIPAHISWLQVETDDLPIFGARTFRKARTNKTVGASDQDGRH